MDSLNVENIPISNRDDLPDSNRDTLANGTKKKTVTNGQYVCK